MYLQIALLFNVQVGIGLHQEFFLTSLRPSPTGGEKPVIQCGLSEFYLFKSNQESQLSNFQQVHHCHKSPNF